MMRLMGIARRNGVLLLAAVTLTACAPAAEPSAAPRPEDCARTG
jgi:hypothetical protein